MKFSVPAIYTICGWIEIEADDLASAKAQASKLNDEGIEFNIIKDSEANSEILVKEIEEIPNEPIHDMDGSFYHKD